MKLVATADPQCFVFTEDVAFRSPSPGAAGNKNGRTMWNVVETGKTYQEWHDKKLATRDGE